MKISVIIIMLIFIFLLLHAVVALPVICCLLFDRPVTLPVARPYRKRFLQSRLQSRLPRPVSPVASLTLICASLPFSSLFSSPFSSPSSTSVFTRVSVSTAPTFFIGSGLCLYCGDGLCVGKRWCPVYRHDLDTGRIYLDARNRICLGPAVVRMRLGIF
jgi:hypothetical protein